MDYSDFDNVKREKANAMTRYRRLQKIAKLFRVLEIFFALILLSWFSTHLPSVFEISGKYLKKLCVVVVSPRFVFVIGNAIIVTLFLKSGQISTKSLSENKEETNLYEEFVKTSGENRQKVSTEERFQTEEIVFQDKETVLEDNPVPISPRLKTQGSPPRSMHRDVQPEIVLKKKSYRRSQSENMQREIAEKPRKTLRRSETEKCGEVEYSKKVRARKTDAEREMSNEEFQRTIEAFIAKQVKFHWEESMAIVVQNQS